ncbi:hypothetical protein HMPREF0239_03035 [Clostridium sp. ATCC BAA-442]|nr:hypothetical protein HMPREF0239_03035 [Clostridium sp. ATCC BAA-442]
MTFSASIVLIPPPLYSIVLLYNTPMENTRNLSLFCHKKRERAQSPLPLSEVIV